ncbi:MAG TPA: ATP-dependent DNA helicase [Methylomirabilota bacterium]|nr:ATP-dependent DNA helicase [Methylomirabilota bacterium]
MPRPDTPDSTARPGLPDDAAARILAALNPAQTEAVIHDRGPLLIVAGAGTGKTTVLTRRIAHLIATRRARPDEILALTFTDKAALEMEERVDVLVPYGYADVRIATFHAFGDWLLREHALEVGLTPAFRVLNRAEQVLFLRTRLFELPLEQFRPLGDPTRHLQALAGLFARAKDEDVTPEAYLAHADALAVEAAAHPDDAERRDLAVRTRELARVYATYCALMAQAGFVDFGDQIYLALRLLRDRPYVLAHYQRRFRYILVDEFQDTNHAQFELVKLLGARHRNVTVVGDDDQAIFRFRGASMSNILGFDAAYPDARRVVLVQNYRSGQRLLDAAHRLIRHNDPDRLESARGIDKRLVATGAPGPEPLHHSYETVTQEADAVARTIEDEVKAGRRAYREFAILVRANADADPFLRSLNLRGIPWTFSGNQGLYTRHEVRLCIAFLRVLARLDDSVSLYALAASPLFSVPAVDLARCGAYADRRNRWLFDVLRGLDHTPELRAALSAEGAQAIGRLVKELERYLTLGAELGTGELLYQFLTDSGWLGRMSRASTAREEAEVQNVARFFRRIQDATRVLPRDHVREFVSHLDALIQAGEDPAVAEADVDVPAVRVLTVHKAKGLEFPVVFVVGLVQGRFPWRSRGEVLELPDALLRDRPSSADFRLQEERRLFYVAMTRAKDALHLTSARDYGGRSTRKVSQFVLEALDLPRDAVSPTKTTALEELRGFASPVELEGQGESPLDPDAVLELSHRQVDDYRTCPLKYRYVHVLRVPIRRHHTVVYGETLHRVVEHYLRRRAAGLYTPLDALLETYEREWRNEGFLTWAHEAARRDAGREAIRRFWHEEEASGTRPTFVEREFGVSLGGAEGRTRVRGRWDRVDETEAGPVIIDYKSSDVREPERATQRAADSLQLQIYGLVWREMFGRLPARVELRFLESGVVGEHEPTEADAAAALEAVSAAAAGIRARNFAATPSYRACRYCAYNQICPYTASRDV